MSDDTITVFVMKIDDEWFAYAGPAATGSGETPEAAVASLADNLDFALRGVDGDTDEEKRLQMSRALRGGRSLIDHADEELLAIRSRFGSAAESARRARISLGRLLEQRSLEAGD